MVLVLDFRLTVCLLFLHLISLITRFRVRIGCLKENVFDRLDHALAWEDVDRALFLLLSDAELEAHGELGVDSSRAITCHRLDYWSRLLELEAAACMRVERLSVGEGIRKAILLC